MGQTPHAANRIVISSHAAPVNATGGAWGGGGGAGCIESCQEHRVSENCSIRFSSSLGFFIILEKIEGQKLSSAGQHQFFCVS
jgi:hypothetical protein